MNVSPTSGHNLTPPSGKGEVKRERPVEPPDAGKKFSMNKSERPQDKNKGVESKKEDSSRTREGDELEGKTADVKENKDIYKKEETQVSSKKTSHPWELKSHSPKPSEVKSEGKAALESMASSGVEKQEAGEVHEDTSLTQPHEEIASADQNQGTEEPTSAPKEKDISPDKMRARLVREKGSKETKRQDVNRTERSSEEMTFVVQQRERQDLDLRSSRPDVYAESKQFESGTEEKTGAKEKVSHIEEVVSQMNPVAGQTPMEVNVDSSQGTVEAKKTDIQEIIKALVEKIQVATTDTGTETKILLNEPPAFAGAELIVTHTGEKKIDISFQNLTAKAKELVDTNSGKLVEGLVANGWAVGPVQTTVKTEVNVGTNTGGNKGADKGRSSKEKKESSV